MYKNLECVYIIFHFYRNIKYIFSVPVVNIMYVCMYVSTIGRGVT